MTNEALQWSAIVLLFAACCRHGAYLHALHRFFGMDKP